MNQSDEALPTRDLSTYIRSIFRLSEIPGSAIAATFTSNIINLALPLAILQVYDRIIPNRTYETLIFLGAALIILVLVDMVARISRSYILGWHAARRATSAVVNAASTITGVPRERVSSERPTDWLDRIEAAAQVESGRGGQPQLVLLDLLFVPIFPLVIAIIGGSLVAVPIIVMSVFAALIWSQGLDLGEAIADRNAQDRRRFDFLAECLHAVQTVKALAMEPQMMRRFERLTKSSASISLRAIDASQKLQVLANLMASVAMISVVSVGALYVIYGSLTIGGLACCSLLSGRMMQPIIRGAGIWAEVQNQGVARQRAEPLIALAMERPRVQVPPREGAARIRVENIAVQGATGRPAIEALSLNAEPGEIVGLTGDCGGWSSVFDVICGDLEPDNGHVQIDGQDAHHLGPELRRAIVRVSSKSQLFQGTVLENLTLFKTGDTLDLAIRLAREIGLEARINRLPKGYDTKVDLSASATLPAGIVQQIAITRALVRSPRALLFDEANTTLDADADAALRAVIAQLAGRTTVLIASNRPSLLGIAGRLYSLEDGRCALADVQVPNDSAMSRARLAI